MSSMPADNPLDRRMLDRIRALLAKAEATPFPEEADAFTAKAQELMAAHAIEQAMLDDTHQRGTVPVSLRISVPDPYATNKSVLLSEIAAANRCEAVFNRDRGESIVFGFDHDLAAVELLFTSLLLQGSRELQAAGAVTDHRGRSRTRSYRASFWTAFGVRIGQRLRAVRDEATVRADAASGGALLPVLVVRSAEVTAALRREFPHTRTYRASVSNAAGWHAGNDAANRAHLGPGGPQVNRRAGAAQRPPLTSSTAPVA